MVQVGHALIESEKNFPYEGEHPYVIVLGTNTEESLKNALAKVEAEGIKCVPFHEPDRDDELTAFATQPLQDRPKLFRRYNLLR